jgi:hypothetical protein
MLLVKVAIFAGISNIRDIGSYALPILIILNRVIGLGKFVHSHNKYRLKSLLDIVKEIGRTITAKTTSSLSIIKEVILLIPGISYKSTINTLGN